MYDRAGLEEGLAASLLELSSMMNQPADSNKKNE